MKNRKRVIIILFILGIVLIGIGIYVSLQKANLNFSNMVITSDSSLSILVSNKGNKKSEKCTMTFYFQNANKDVILSVPIEIPEIKARSEKRIEYQSEYTFKEKPTSFIVKDYQEGDKLENNNISLEASIAIKLEEISKEVISENKINTKEGIIITANELITNYHKNLDFIKDDYKCDLNDTYVDIINGEYTTYITCELFKNKD